MTHVSGENSVQAKQFERLPCRIILPLRDILVVKNLGMALEGKRIKNV